MTSTRECVRTHLQTVFVGVLLLATPALAQRTEAPPDALEGVGITQKLGAQVPLKTDFRDYSGAQVELDRYFHKNRPVILTLNYSSCPMLCYLQLDGLLSALRAVDLVLGRDYDIVTVSIDHNETPQEAHVARKKYLAKYNRPLGEGVWPFLVGTRESIDSVAEAVGFGYRHDEATDEYFHAAAFMVCTQDGTVSRYIYGVLFEPQDVRLALVEAGEGKIGSLSDSFLLYCFVYDPESGSYVVAAGRLMRLAGMLMLLVLAFVGIKFWRMERARAARRAKGTAG